MKNIALRFGATNRRHTTCMSSIRHDRNTINPRNTCKASEAKRRTDACVARLDSPRGPALEGLLRASVSVGKHLCTIVVIVVGLVGTIMVLPVTAGPPLVRCSLAPPRCGPPMPPPRPQCGIELTCTDRPVQLGFSDGVCFRATCSGVWALIHKRADQASFRRRIFTYRHYSFKGCWELKDQGVIESGPIPIRELFLVFPDDLIEFRLREPDPYARVQIKNLGYIKKGNIAELNQWLAYETFMQGPGLQSTQATLDRNIRPRVPVCTTSGPQWLGSGIFSRIRSMGRSVGLSF